MTVRFGVFSQPGPEALRRLAHDGVLARFDLRHVDADVTRAR